ncbi:hypothetical protein Pint_17630 [Pistacia integerrima]|uniref:Uncharacterized protein n=1 Tax=Pistacia integerrima TaxID=434235 RepID=A0ACC0YXD5_9ROSI|nr:hypothetical protein Pint_17630 [Pistacia integerrima]
MRLLCILTFSFAGTVCALSVFAAILSKNIPIKIAIDVLSFPGALLLLLSTYKEDKYDESEAKISESGLWVGRKLLRRKIYPVCMRQIDRAESCYLQFLDQLNKQKQIEPSSQPINLEDNNNMPPERDFHFWGKTAFQYEGYVLAMTPFISKGLESLSQRQWYFRSRVIGLKVRSLLTASIYKKQLRLSNAARLKHSGGEIMNYVTVDAYGIGEFPFWFHQTWTTSLRLCIAIEILFRAVGLTTFAALVVIILTVLCGTPLAKLQHKFQSKLMVAQDERLKATTEALVNMKVLKLYAWETHFKNFIENLRKLLLLGHAISSRLPLYASNVFTFVATLCLVQGPIRNIPDVVGAVIQAKVSFTRIVKFLEAPDLQSANVRQKSNLENVNHAVFIKSTNFSWEENCLKPTIKNISLEVRPGEKVAICGEVGSGKSTLIAAILVEVPNTEGIIQVYGKIAYVSQTAWTGSIRENILFGSSMDTYRYHETLERCSLVKDLELLPYGDQTEIVPSMLIQLQEYVMGALSRKAVLLVTHQVDFLPTFDSVLLMSDGEILKTATYHQLLSSSKEFQDLVNAYKETAGSEKLAEVTSQNRGAPAKEIKRGYVDKQSEASKSDQLIKKEEREIGDTGFKPYTKYLKQSKGFLFSSMASLFQLIFVTGQILQNTWMASNVDNPHVSTLRLIVVYIVIGFTSTLFLLFRSLSTVVLGIRSAQSLFSQLLDSLFRAPMSFYDSTPLGRVLSRVSFDLSIVDLDIPFNLILSVAATINAYSNLGVLVVVTWQVLFVSIPVIFMAIRLQRCYFYTAKELMRISGTTKSLVANHLAESIAGATTIRAFQEEERFFGKNLDIIDTNASPFFHSFAANEWLIQRLETLSAAVISSAALLMVLLPPGTFSSGFIGMALSYGLSLNVFVVMSIQNQCTIANYIISVERLNQYMNVPSEAPEVIKDNRPPPNWPAMGKVDICDLQIRYRPDAPLVLRGISCTFEGGHKIGIVGRTGSGKTTLIGALFRLVEPAGGKIIVDSIDICKIGLHDLRSCFGIIPQDPTLFNGSVRYNLGPLSQHTDQEIWEVLGKCQLREAVQEKDEGLDSLGKLHCDHCGSPTVMDCTMVLAISDGKLVEYDEPMKLMKREGSLLGQLVKEYWSHLQSAESH